MSSSNKVKGEGIIRWLLENKRGNQVPIELPGYHIPNADVRLLSPQVLLNTIGGQCHQTVSQFNILLENGIDMCASLCPQSNLPILPLSNIKTSDGCFWSAAFAFSAANLHDLNTIRNVLHRTNSNLSYSQKELLLWHQRLSHASTKWIQALMSDRKWLNNDENHPLHSSPLLTTKMGSRAHCCDRSTLLCAACLYAKASVRSPSNQAPRPAPTNKNILKSGHLRPGDCLSVDHYFSPIVGWLPHTFGKE